MGLIARTIEASGIPTVCLIGLREIAEQVRPPRSVHLKWPFGHPLGEPGNRAQQLCVIQYALSALYTIAESGTILEPGWRWRREQYAEPESWAMPHVAGRAGIGTSPFPPHPAPHMGESGQGDAG